LGNIDSVYWNKDRFWSANPCSSWESYRFLRTIMIL